MASQANLPSVTSSNNQGVQDLCSQIFDYIPSTVNTKQGAAKYDNQDQAFSFSHKQVRFQEGDSSPNLDPTLSSSQGPRSSAPYHAVTTAFNETFDISQISPLAMASTHQDAVVIAAEISAAMAAHASKEFHHIREPKITKLKGGYSAKTEFVFWSWHADIKAHIRDCDLNNSAALQLIKDQTQEGTWCEVEYQLDLCGGVINYH